MFDLIRQPWPWYVAGPLIGLTIPALLLLGNKYFGISSSLRHICAACLPAKIPFFQYNWKKEAWNLFFVAGILIGGIIASHVLSNPKPIVVAQQTTNELEALGIPVDNNLMPLSIFSIENIFNLKGLIFCCWWIYGWVWNPICRGMYFRSLHHGAIYPAMAITYSYMLFHDWRFYHDAPYFSLASLNCVTLRI